MLRAPSLLLLLACVFNAKAQTVEREVVGSDGGASANGEVYWQWNLGETITGTFSNGHIFTQGFEQSDSNAINSALVPEIQHHALQLISDPLGGLVHLDLGEPGSKWNVELFDFSGKSLEKTVLLVHSQNGVDLDVARFGSGRFVLKVRNADQDIDKIFTFVKTK